jgi:serine/threonine protein phosphatase PrpC
MAISISYAAASEPGQRFPANEDRWLADPELGLYAVADGMADEQAPQIIVERLPGMLEGSTETRETWSDPKVAEHVRKALLDLSVAIRDQSQTNPDEPTLAATLVLALLRANQAIIGHLGTCRAYLWREGFLEPLTRDHSLVQRYLGLGVLKPEQATQYPFGGGPTNYLGMNGEPTPAVRSVPLSPGDQLLLCSAGLNQTISDWQIHDLLNQWKAPAEACQHLVAAAKQAGARDSTTALIVAVSES